MRAEERTAVIVLSQRCRQVLDNLNGSSDVREQRLHDSLQQALRDVCVVCKLGEMDPPWNSF